MLPFLRTYVTAEHTKELKGFIALSLEKNHMDVEVILQKGAAAWCKEPEESVSRDGGRMLYLMQQDYIMSDGRGPLCSHL